MTVITNLGTALGSLLVTAFVVAGGLVMSVMQLVEEHQDLKRSNR